MGNEKGNGVKFVQLLIEHKANVNRIFAMFVDRKAAMTALDFAGTQEKYLTLLKAAGAKSAKQLLAENPKAVVEDATN